ncbi:BppU family phage baseplate upper protein [Tuberibacillus sp. Marseille-P3662]|uniref:BppU family phage baseplate upper protein n=1 Tax=Tuberibacillus sp. Marseille-P3662 TaxID=1965358 RepID=UPI001593CEAD|nr:BppU family phage baseplate upper protein [Tuberibacillus sp. Marseille-P3662]
MTFKIKQNDTKIALKAVLENESGAIDLTGATVRFLMSNYSRSENIIDGLGDIKDAVNGEVWYVFSYDETDQAGIFKAEFEATFSDGRIETFPTEDYLTIEIIQDLG